MWDISAYAAFGLLASYIFISSQFHYSQFGTIDFIEYWSALKLALGGLNPYSYGDMLTVQRELAPEAKTPTMMWNPPHLLPLIRPIANREFQVAAGMFCGLSLACMALTISLTCKLLGAKEGQRGRVWFLGLTLPATLTCLNIGQLGNILSLALIGGIILYHQQRRFLAGCSFAVCSIKPHLFLLVVSLFLFDDLLHKRFKTLLGGILTCATLCTITHFLFPQAFAQWIYALQHPEDFQLYNVLNWRPATLVGLFRVLYWRATDLPMPLTPMWLLPTINILIWIYIATRVGTERIIKDYLPEILICSALFSPYGWIFDQSFLLPAWAWAYLRFEQRNSLQLLTKMLLFIGAMSGTFLMIMILGLVSESFVILTLLILVVVLWARKHGERAEINALPAQ